MSDKPEQKKGWFQRLTSGLTRTSQAMTEQVTGVFTKKPLDQEQLDALEEMLIEADLGPQIAARITEAFGKARFGKSSTDDEVKAALAELIAARVAGTRQPERPNRLRGELAALAVLFLSARYRVSRTDDAIEAVRKAYLSGRIHQEIEEQTDDDANPVRGPELSPDPGVPQGV